MRGRRIWASLAMATLTGSLVVAPVQALAAGAPRGTVIDGMVMANGHRVAGARVILYAWPSQKVTAAVRKGHRVPMSVVGSAVSSASGRYAVAISNWPALRRSADHGIVNLELEAFAGGHASTFSFSRKITGGGLAADNEARVPQMTPQRADLSMHAETPHSPGRPPALR